MALRCRILPNSKHLTKHSMSFVTRKRNSLKIKSMQLQRNVRTNNIITGSSRQSCAACTKTFRRRSLKTTGIPISSTEETIQKRMIRTATGGKILLKSSSRRWKRSLILRSLDYLNNKFRGCTTESIIVISYTKVFLRPNLCMPSSRSMTSPSVQSRSKSR